MLDFEVHIRPSPTEAMRLRFDKKKSLHSRLLVEHSVCSGASPSATMTMRRYKLKVRPVGDCEVIFFLIEFQSRRLSSRRAIIYRHAVYDAAFLTGLDVRYLLK
jgi:hypothetical protein